MVEPFGHQRIALQPFRKFLKSLNSFWEVWVRERKLVRIRPEFSLPKSEIGLG